MITRRLRLTKKDDVSSILKTGGSLMGKRLVMRIRPNELDHHRFSVIVSTKVTKKAVQRNRLKRQMYEVVRLNYKKFPKNHHFDILILPKTSIIGASYAEIQDDLFSLIPKIRPS